MVYFNVLYYLTDGYKGKEDAQDKPEKDEPVW